MAASKKILVADDMGAEPAHQKRSKSVRRQAAFLAGALGVRIDLLHVENLEPFPIDVPFFRPLADQFSRDRRSRLEKLSKDGKLSMRPVFVEGPVVPGIFEQLRRESYEMVVMGTQGRKGLTRLLVGSVAEEVIRNSRIPVMTIGPAAASSAAAWPDEPVLVVATELGANSRKAETYAASLAKRLGARLVLVMGFRDSLHPILRTAEDYPNKRQEIQQVLADELAQTKDKLEARCRQLRKLGIGCVGEVDRSSDSASEAILKVSRRVGASAIVMGTHGKNFATSAFLGSTSRAAILQSPVPVITVRSR